MPQLHSERRILCSLVLLGALAGCGRDQTVVEFSSGVGDPISVKGRVTLDDNPLSGALVTFHPEWVGMNEVSVLTGSDGTYEIGATSTDGATPGPHKVTISHMLDSSGKPLSRQDVSKVRNAERLPRRFSNSEYTILRVTLKADKVNTHDFPLSSSSIGGNADP